MRSFDPVVKIWVSDIVSEIFVPNKQPFTAKTISDIILDRHKCEVHPKGIGMELSRLGYVFKNQARSNWWSLPSWNC